MNGKEDEILLEALKKAVAAMEEQRLFRSGKWSGLFPSKHGVSGAAATRAVRDGLFEVVRVEKRGKVSIDWVRITPAGVDHLYHNESPVILLRELKQNLASSQQSLPAFLNQLNAEWKQTLQDFSQRLETTQRTLHSLAHRVEEALRRLDTPPTSAPETVARSTPWSDEALAYLERRQIAGVSNGCPLPELFAAVRSRFPELSLIDFHSGLRRLHDHRALRLLPFDGPAEKIPQPEYALLEGAQLMYYAER